MRYTPYFIGTQTLGFLSICSIGFAVWSKLFGFLINDMLPVEALGVWGIELNERRSAPKTVTLLSNHFS